MTSAGDRAEAARPRNGVEAARSERNGNILLGFGFFMGLAQPFATVGQVQAHRRAGRIGILAGDGLVDLFMLAAQPCVVLLLVGGYIASGSARTG